MNEQIATSAPNVSPSPDLAKRLDVEKPTAASEWTLLGASGGLFAFALLVIAVLASPRWDAATANLRIWFLGWMGLLAVGGNLLLIVAIASPWVGKITASVAGAELDLEGRP